MLGEDKEMMIDQMYIFGLFLDNEEKKKVYNHLLINLADKFKDLEFLDGIEEENLYEGKVLV